jgi:hypothetical protein
VGGGENFFREVTSAGKKWKLNVEYSVRSKK